MLVKFSVQNYRGFKDKLEWDLTKKSNYEFNSFAIRNGVVKNGIIYGKNGCGKSNLGLAVMDITNHLGDIQPSAPFFRLNYVYAGNPESSVTFEYVFKFGADEVVYAYQKGDVNQYPAIIAEKLTCNKKTVFDFIINRKCELSREFAVNENETGNLMENANHISIVNYILSHFPLGKKHCIYALKSFVRSMLWFRSVEGVHEFKGAVNNFEHFESYIIRNGLQSEFSSFLLELSEQKYDFEKPEPNQKNLICNIGGQKIPFVVIESTGTASLTGLFYWYKHMQNSSFVFVDEFDAFYHFELSWKVCKKLFGLDCQVFLTTHNTLLLSNDLLRPDCNFLLDNNRIKPLCDCTDKELRQGHNIEKLYRGGAFSA